MEWISVKENHLTEKGEVKWSKQGKCPVTPEQFEVIYNDDTDEKGGERE